MKSFIINYDIDNIQPADYNPRKITSESFEKLKESLNIFGVCKPVIANKNGIIIAGHQRTKAMKAIGLKKCPIFILDKKVAIHDEIRFNLMHNSIETETSKCKILNADSLSFGFNEIEPKNISSLKKGSGSLIKEICLLLNKYGDFDSVVIDESGNIIHNSDYAFCCKILNKHLIVYKMENEKAKIFLNYINGDYGSYDYEVLGIKPYVQTHCQMSRNGETVHSRLYEKFVLKDLAKSKSIVDFGAGKMFYINSLKDKGYDAFGYEPFYKVPSTELLSISDVLKHIDLLQKRIEAKGLFDMVVLDSVINSITSNQYEDYVLKCCNALMKEDGVFYTGTRNKYFIQRRSKNSQVTDKTRTVEFLDNQDFSATFRKGVWTLQKFHTAESLESLLLKYFEDVSIYGKTESQLYAVCKKPKRFTKEEYFEALNEEFNLEYPKGYKHNKQKKIVDTILNCL